MTVDEAMQIGRGHHQAGRLGEAEAIYRQVLNILPAHAGALYLLGVIVAQRGRRDLAIELIRQSVNADPNDAPAYNDLGVLLKESGQLHEAMVASQRAVELAPEYALAHSNLAAVLIEREEYETAANAARRAIGLSPTHADAFVNLAGALRAMGKYTEAMDALRSALSVRPDHAEAHWNLGRLLMLVGDFKQGWTELEWRLPNTTMPWDRVFPPSQPIWDGTDLRGKTILLYTTELGLGDTLQFIRYVPLVAARNGRVVLQCQCELVRLLAGFPGTERVLALEEKLPAFDVQCDLTSLMAVLDTRIHTIPPMRQPLRPDASVVEIWRKRIGSSNGRLRVGLVWKTGAVTKVHRRRDMRLKNLALLANVTGAEFFSLQKGGGVEEIQEVPEFSLVHHTAGIRDMADTAALIMQLDLVVTVDTSVAHLAGTMGKRTWLMLPTLADWRWQIDGDDSPWYPSMRLFRQKIAGDWSGVVNDVYKALSDLASKA